MALTPCAPADCDCDHPASVPAVMRAMTMMFKVEPAVLEKVKAAAAIQALKTKCEDGWWLHAIEVIAPSGTHG